MAHRLPRIGPVLVATLFFLASLTPSLIPRSFAVQGVLAGVCFAIGYGLGLPGAWLWRRMKLPAAQGRLWTATERAMILLCILAMAGLSWRTIGWQNSARALTGVEPVTAIYPFVMLAVAVVTVLAIYAIVRFFGMVFRLVAGGVGRLLPRRMARIIGFAAALLLFWSITERLLFGWALRALDSSYAAYDALIEPERARPLSPLKTGSAASLLAWDRLGRAGREYIASAPGAAEIGAISGTHAREPIRVYAGLRSADSAQARARLALAELKRVGAFGRPVLIVITPTGTGWVDPAAIESVEYLLGGDVASVALQYSYLSSPLSLLFEPDFGAEAARALFVEIYGYWRTLPKDQRPRLYLHGLSLGALHSERSAQLFEMLADPIQGALWSGPPFASRVWRSLTDARNPGSPEWLPSFRDGAFVRFANQHGWSDRTPADWGPMRIAYLQYASDGVTFFDPRSLYRPPDWMRAPRGPDVSPELRWFPVVTMLQLAVDMGTATKAPPGHGHVYAPGHYLDAWIAVTGAHWPVDRLAMLKRHLEGGAAEGDKGPYEDRGG